MNIQSIRQFYDYNFWAHKRVWESVEQLTDEQFLREIDYSVGSIRNQLVHTMSYEWVYLRRMQGEADVNMLPYEDFPTRHHVKAHWQTVETAWRVYLDILTDAELVETVSYYSVGGDEYTNTRIQLLQHLANHSTDHRAQTLAMMHLMGITTQPQDFIYYLRDPNAGRTS